jgi:hypothetical protein
MSNSTNSQTPESQIPEAPEEFKKVVQDFINDMVITFPEYENIINKWWKAKSFDKIEDIEERKSEVEKDTEKNIKFIFNHCIRVYPERFFDILYKNAEMFDNDSSVNTDFLPGISFKYLWQLDISEKTRETIWKYLQLISLSVIGSVHNKEAFGNTAKLFENIDENDFKEKLEETLEKMQELFDGNFDSNNETNLGGETNNGTGTGTGTGINMENMPSANDIHNHINSMLNGKIGVLAKEIAEDTAKDLNIDMDNAGDIKGVFQNLFKNPGKLMGMVKNVGDKLDKKIKSGDIKESELIAEASEIMNNMKNMPGMGDIQSMLGKMGMGGAGGKMNMNAMQSKLQQNMKMAQMKERMKNKTDARAQAQAQAQAQASVQNSTPVLTDEQLISVFSTGEKVERTPVGAKPTKNKKNKNKKK